MVAKNAPSGNAASSPPSNNDVRTRRGREEEGKEEKLWPPQRLKKEKERKRKGKAIQPSSQVVRGGGDGNKNFLAFAFAFPLSETSAQLSLFFFFGWEGSWKEFLLRQLLSTGSENWLSTHFLLPHSVVVPNHQRRHAKWKLSRNMHTSHTRFLHVWHRFVCSVGACRQNFCVGAQSEPY